MTLLSCLLHRLLGRPRALFAGMLFLTVLLLPLLRRLDLQGDLVDLLPRSSPAAQTFATFNRSLGAGQELIVLLTGSDAQKLVDFAEAYAAALQKLPDVQQVTYRIGAGSLTYLRDHLLLLLSESDLDELAKRLEPEALRTRAERLRALFLAPGGSALAPLYTADPLELVPLLGQRLSAANGLPVDTHSGYFRTADGSALLLKVRPSFEPLKWQRAERLLADASRLAVELGGELATRPDVSLGARFLRRLGPLGRDLQTTSFQDGPRPKVAFTGSYAFPPHYRRWLEQDMTISTVLSVGAVLLLFGLFFRSLRILPVVFLPLGLAGLWTALGAAFFFHRLSGVSMAFASILVAIGIDLPIQIYNRLREELLQCAEDLAPAAVRQTVTRTVCLLAGPALIATLGPAAVFLACGLSDYKGLNQLGILAGLGLVLNCLAMLTVFPALLLILPVRYWHRPEKVSAARSKSSWLEALGRRSARAPWRVLFLAGILLLCALPWVGHLQFSERLFALEPGDMPPALAQAEIARRFGEKQRFLVALIEDSDKERALLRGDAWQAEAERLRQAGLLRGYEAISTLVPSETTQEARRARLQKLLFAQGVPAAAQNLQQALLSAGFAAEPFQGFLQQLRTDTKQLPALTLDGLLHTELGFLVRSHVADNEAGRFLALYLFAPADKNLQMTLTALRRFASGPTGGMLTGLPLLEEELRSLLETDLLRVTLASLLAVTSILLLYYRRWRPFLAVFIPLSGAWVLFAAAHALLHIPLNLYNLLAVPLCIGYGIDDHIFLVHRHEATPPEKRDPAAVLRTTGRAIVLTTLATGAGFAGLLPAHFVGLRLLGLSGALAVLLCLCAAYLVLPALLQLLWPPSKS